MTNESESTKVQHIQFIAENMMIDVEQEEANLLLVKALKQVRGKNTTEDTNVQEPSSN